MPGGSGFLGRALASHLAARGHQVLVLTRGRAGVRNGVEFVHWDAAQLGDWVGALEGADAVVHLTGKRVDAAPRSTTSLSWFARASSRCAWSATRCAPSRGHRPCGCSRPRSQSSGIPATSSSRRKHLSLASALNIWFRWLSRGSGRSLKPQKRSIVPSSFELGSRSAERTILRHAGSSHWRGLVSAGPLRADGSGCHGSPSRTSWPGSLALSTSRRCAVCTTSRLPRGPKS